MPSEQANVKRILTTLNGLPQCHAEKRWGNPYEGGGKADITGCYRGRRFELEAKRVGAGARANQLWRLEQWRRAGAIVGVVVTPDDARRLLESDHDAAGTAGGTA